MATEREHTLSLGSRSVSALSMQPGQPAAMLAFGHGAGANMRHASMTAIAEALAEVGVATYRFNFPFMEDGRNRVDAKDVSTAAIAKAVAAARKLGKGLPLFLGGHSFGGRMASHAVLDHGLELDGMIFCSFPLHTAKKPSLKRAEHLDQITAPKLFLSGTRDGMADHALMEELTSRLGATLHWLDTADHGYKVLKRTRTRQDDVFTEIATTARQWIEANGTMHRSSAGRAE